jgi:hypothetical protein
LRDTSTAAELVSQAEHHGWDGFSIKDLSTGEWKPITPDILREISDYCRVNRQGDRSFEINWEGTTSGDNPNQAAQQVQPWADAGAKWWIEAMWQAPDSVSVQKLIQQGPPRI